VISFTTVKIGRHKTWLEKRMVDKCIMEGIPSDNINALGLM
jgi:hypothetical protein